MVLGKGAIAAVFLSGMALADEPLKIAALGDSLTHGFGLPQEDGFVPQLERWLADQGTPARVLNAGVSGDTTAGGLSRMAWTLADGPDAMIVWLGGNDLLRGIAPEAARASLSGIVSTARDAGVEVLLIGIDAPGNYGPDYKRDFDAIYPAVAAEYGALYFEDLLAPLLDAMEGGTQGLVQSDGLHPSRDGVAVIVDTVGPAVQTLIERVQANGSDG